MTPFSPLLLLAGLLPFAPLLFAQDKKEPKDKPAPPRVRYAVPLAVTSGVKVKVALRGQGLDGVTEVKVTAGKLTVVGKGGKAGVPNNYPAAKLGDSEVTVELELPKDYAGEAVELTAVGPAGAGEMYRLTVVRSDVAEKEPNDGFDTAQVVPLPVTVAGTIGREKDVDLYQFTGRAGQTVTVDVRAARLGAPTDVLVTLYDAGRNVIATVDDTDGRPDPTLTAKLPKDGVYFVSVLEAHDLGGAQFGYRLRVE